MFTPKANSKQKIGGRIAAFAARFLSNQTGKTAQKIGVRVWQFGGRF